MFCCICYKKDKLKIFLKKQKKEEYKNIKVNMYTLGNYEPIPVYYGNKEYYTNEDILKGLNAMCINEIHISIGNNPNRLILSHIRTQDNKKYKDECFYIMQFIIKEVTTISQITQYDIYCAIQEYILINKKEPKYENGYMIAL